VLAYNKMAVTRSLLSKCVDSDEIGKAFAILSVVATLASFAGNPLFRQLYNVTMADFPGAVFVLFGCLQLVASLCSLCVFFKRKTLLDEAADADIEN
jgi:MFS-type transporter involved in bile tolerance (Atg22 family)